MSPRRLLDFTIVRLVIALFATALAGGLTAQFVSDHAPARFHDGWPSLCGAIAALLAYASYVRLVERRPVSELAAGHAVGELAIGLLGGGALVALVVATLALLGAYRFAGVHLGAEGMVAGFAQMVFVGVFEELLMRGVLLRIVERSLASWPALAISSLLFGVAHAPGTGASLVSMTIAVVAGVFFGAAYLATRRLWLCIALHVGWNFTLGFVFSMSVSGHERTPGLLEGSLDGAQWLTGGAYGLEASVLTLVALDGATAWLLWRAVMRGRFVAWHSRASRRMHGTGLVADGA